METLVSIVRPYTLVSPEQIHLLVDLARRANENAIPGDMVECGVCNGGSAAILAHFAAQAGRRTWLFDSFKGMPATTSKDGVAAEPYVGQCVGSIDTVKEVLALAGADMGRVEIVKGWFHETFPTVSVPQIAVLSLDSDWYESEKLCLQKFYDSVSPGGFVYFDDFYYWPGCRLAAEEFFAGRGTPTFNQVEHSAWLQKPAF